MPVWGWIVIGVVLAAMVLPIKLKILKKMMNKKNQDNTLDE
jgi:hypothetical protein